MDAWLILLVLLAVVALGAGAGAYYLIRRNADKVSIKPPVITPEYVTGGDSYMITLGIGTPAEIYAFILFGLSSGYAPPSTDDILYMNKKPHMPFPGPGFF